MPSATSAPTTTAPSPTASWIGFQLICPRHGARFDIRSGKALTLPAFIDTPWYPVRVVDGMIEIGLPVE